ncbi:MAG: Tol-Pal system beta propeller repeat protein TolB [bacterium]
MNINRNMGNIIKRTVIFLLVMLAFCGLLALRAESADVYLDVTKLAKKINIFVPDFIKDGSVQETDALSREITDILRNDLNFSGIFSVQKGTGFEGKDFEALQALKIDAILRGTYKIEEDDLVLECHAFDVKKGQPIMGKKFSSGKRYLRYIVHQMSDEIVFSFSGTRGIAHTKIAFIAEVDGYKEVFIVDYDGHNLRKITDDKSINVMPMWSPDGRKIIYSSYRNINPDLYEFDLKYFSSSLISGLPGLNVSAEYSPNGKYIAITLSKDGDPDIYILRSNGKNPRRVTYSRANDTSASWAPNGREITFTSNRAGSPQIYVMDLEGTNLRRLTYRGSYNDSSCWSPRADKIAYVSRTSGRFDIYTITPDGYNVRRLTRDSGSNENPSFSPDGQYIVFSSTRSGKRDLYIMKSDGSDQRKLLPGEVASAIKGDLFAPSWGP